MIFEYLYFPSFLSSGPVPFPSVLLQSKTGLSTSLHLRIWCITYSYSFTEIIFQFPIQEDEWNVCGSEVLANVQQIS